MLDTYPTVMSALTRRYTLVALLSGRCTLAQAGQGPHVSDPHALLEEAADLANAMKACTAIEACALELEITRPDMPVSRPKIRPGGNVTRRARAVDSKCDVMQRSWGGSWYFERFTDTVCDAYAKARQGLLASGLVDESWRERAVLAVDPLVRFDYRGARWVA